MLLLLNNPNMFGYVYKESVKLSGKYGIPAPWYFPFKGSFWADLCCCFRSKRKAPRGLLFTNIMERNLPVFFEDKKKGIRQRCAVSAQLGVTFNYNLRSFFHCVLLEDQNSDSPHVGENFSHLPVGVSLHGLSKLYGDRVAIQNLNISFYEGHVTTLLGHNGAGKTTTMYVGHSCLSSVLPESACPQITKNAVCPLIHCLLSLIQASL